MLDINKEEEMKQFRIVNGEAKSVRTDLVNMILAQLVEREGEGAVTESDQWKVAATHVVSRLNQDHDGPWFDRIVMPDSRSYSKEEVDGCLELRHRRTARATSFVSSLKPLHRFLVEMVMTGSPSVQDQAAILFDCVDGFWCAVRSINSDCFDQADDYVMLKTPGIFSLHRFCLNLAKTMARRGCDLTQSEFADRLADCPEIGDPAYWHKEKGDAAKYGSQKGFMELGDLLWETWEGNQESTRVEAAYTRRKRR
jgi:hypothetical protein